MQHSGQNFFERHYLLFLVNILCSPVITVSGTLISRSSEKSCKCHSRNQKHYKCPCNPGTCGACDQNIKQNLEALLVSMQSRPVKLAPKTIDPIQKYYTCNCIQACGVCTQSIGQNSKALHVHMQSWPAELAPKTMITSQKHYKLTRKLDLRSLCPKDWTQ